MNSNVSNQTILKYLPIVKAIYADFEIELAGGLDLDKQTYLEFRVAENEFGHRKFIYAMKLMGLWLKDTDFEVKHYGFQKRNIHTRWEKLLKILTKKLIEYQNTQSIIVISLSKSGTMTRDVEGQKFTHDFSNDGLKLKIIRMLQNAEDFTGTDKIAKTEKTSEDSIRDTIGAINRVLRSKLQLPRTYNFIEGKNGYKINSLYNLVIL